MPSDPAATALWGNSRPNGFFESEVREITTTPIASAVGSSLDPSNGLLEHLADAAFAIRSDGRIVVANQAARRLLGYSREELLGMSAWDIDADRGQPQWSDAWQRLLDDSPQRAQARLLGRDGHNHPVELNTALVSIDRQLYGIATARMIAATDVGHADLLSAQGTLAGTQGTLAGAERIARLGHWALDPATGRAHWSDQVFSIFARERARGEPTLAQHRRYVHRSDWRLLARAVAECADNDEPYDIKLRIRREDGSPGHARVCGTVVQGDNGRVARLAGFVQDISEEQRLEAALRQSEEHYRLLVEHQSELVVKSDAAGRLSFVSPSCCRFFGKRENELLGKAFSTLVHPDDFTSVRTAMSELAQPPHRCFLELRAGAASGWRWLEWSSSAVLDGQQQVAAIIGVGRDIHQRKLAEQALEETKRRLDLALEAGGIGTYSANFVTGTVAADDRYLTMLGYSPADVQVTVEWWRQNAHPDDLASFADQSEQVMRGGLDHFTAEYRMRHRDGDWIWIQDHARIHERDANGIATAGTGLHIDVTRRKEAELRLAYSADHDALTQLLNRRGVWEAINRIHAQSQRGKRAYAIAILDLDHFKQVNDSFGHVAGDHLLREIATLLRENARESDWIGRWGGEEFVLLLPDTDTDQALTFIERLRTRIADSEFRCAGHVIRITASAGIAACSSHCDNPDEVINEADTALYQAKRSGRNRVRCHGAGHAGGGILSAAVLVEDAVRAASVRASVQPIVALADRRLVGEETFARLIASDGRALTAASFIDVAEQLGLLHRIDGMLFTTMLSRLRNRSQPASVPQFIHLCDDLLKRSAAVSGLVDGLEALSDKATARRIILTIDERQITTNAPQAAKALGPLLERGCRLAVAGFGGEASSFRFLTHLPVGFVMLDPALVRLAADSERARSVLDVIQGAARDLAIITIGKQVEDEATADRLAAAGIDWAQGYLFGAPSDAKETSLRSEPPNR